MEEKNKGKQICKMTFFLKKPLKLWLIEVAWVNQS